MNLLPGHPTIVILASLAHLEAGHLGDAERLAATALELTRRHGARGDEAWSLHLIGEIAMRREPPEYEGARDRLAEALGLAERLGMAPLEAQCRLSLGALHRRTGGSRTPGASCRTPSRCSGGCRCPTGSRSQRRSSPAGGAGLMPTPPLPDDASPASPARPGASAIAPER